MANPFYNANAVRIFLLLYGKHETCFACQFPLGIIIINKLINNLILYNVLYDKYIISF